MNDGRTIILHPTLRLKENRESAWLVFNHELGHLFNCAMRGKGLVRYMRVDGKRTIEPWVDISHKRMDQTATPMSALMFENPGIFSPAME